MAESPDAGGTPVVSVLMPTYQQAAYLPRALDSLLNQSFTDWELVVVDDGSRDGTADLLAGCDDPRIRVTRLPYNHGLGAALNRAVAAARGRYLAYLPSDDVMDREHLATAVRLLDNQPEVNLAYAGLRWRRAPAGKLIRRFTISSSLRDDVEPGQEERLLDAEPPADTPVRSGNPFALVQVVHRRGLDDTVRWTERHERVSDTLELDFWTGLLRAGARFAYTGVVSCEWGDHPEQHHKIVAGRGVHPADPLDLDNGLSYYRQFYRVDGSQWLDWQPVNSGMPVDERARYGPLPAPPPPRPDGLRILLVGAIGFNPERILAFEEQGHRLAGLWLPKPPYFESTGPYPFGNVTDIFAEGDWLSEVRRFRPDVVYGLLNWHAIPVVHDVIEADLGVPVVFHLKESMTMAIQMGLWPQLREVFERCAGRIFISPENREWCELTLGLRFPESSVLILDGDPPKADWMTDEWSPKLSDADGEPHTVCTGRIFVEPLADLTAAGIHVHVYGTSFRRWGADWMRGHLDSRYLHQHATVEPRYWVRELSRYDAGWCHVHTSTNDGDIRRAEWNDLNLPARIGTYAMAGLPWLFRDNTGHTVAVQRLAEEYGVGIPYRDGADLAERLRAERSHRQGQDAMRRARAEFTFDHHVPRLVDFFEKLIAG